MNSRKKNAGLLGGARITLSNYVSWKKANSLLSLMSPLDLRSQQKGIFAASATSKLLTATSTTSWSHQTKTSKLKNYLTNTNQPFSANSTSYSNVKAWPRPLNSLRKALIHLSGA